MDYKQSFVAHRSNPTQHSLTLYIDSHNAYVQQLHATNAMLEAYHCETLPQLLLELEDIYNDLCSIISEAVLQGAEAISTKVSTFLQLLYRVLNVWTPLGEVSLLRTNPSLLMNIFSYVSH